MLSLKNLELLIVISVRFRGAVPAAAGGPGPFTLGCCIAMSADRGVLAGSSPSSLARPVTEKGESHSNDLSLAVNLGCQAVILPRTRNPRACRIPIRLE